MSSNFCPRIGLPQALSDLFDAPLICSASIVAWVGKKAQALRRVYERIGERVAEAKVRHPRVEEPGGGVSHCRQAAMAAHDLEPGLHLLSRRRKTRCDPGGFARRRRRARPLLALPPARTVDHAFCNADILREPNSLIEFDKEVWAELMRDMLLAANLAVNKAREAGAAGLAPAELKAFLERYWAAVRLGLAFHRDLPKLATKAAPGRVKHRPGHNLLQRLKTFQTETLRFLTHFDAPFTDNLAGQDLRMMKVKMKISGSFRTLEGAQIFATLRSVVSTARKRGLNILQILTATQDQLTLALAPSPTAWELRKKNPAIPSGVAFGDFGQALRALVNGFCSFPCNAAGRRRPAIEFAIADDDTVGFRFAQDNVDRFWNSGRQPLPSALTSGRLGPSECCPLARFRREAVIWRLPQIGIFEMAKRYGNRWEITDAPDLGKGGQSRVFVFVI
jgi:transposase